MKRVHIKTEIKEADGSIASTEREEILENSGLLEAWGFLLLIIFTIATTIITYQMVSNIIHRSNDNGIQSGQDIQY